MKRFFSNSLPLIVDADSRHAAKTLRCKENDRIEIVDGKGNLYEATIFSISKIDISLVDINLIKFVPPFQKLSIAIAPPKNPSRLEWFVEKATEIGIANIYLLETKRTEKLNVKTERLTNIMISAMKQSQQLYLPQLFPIQNLKSLVENTSAFKHRFIAHCSNSDTLLLQNCYTKGEELLVLIGPEGDFTADEVAFCKQHNFNEISLGNSILRTETAGVYVSALIRQINN